jgi:cytochrome c biogenesis protein CcmG, thiol:disulfide interchange protein DsbE
MVARMSTARRGAIVAIALVSTLAAQVKKGDVAPPFTFHQVWNDGPQGFDALAGSVVILEFGHPDVEVCHESMPRLNELHAKYGRRGLMVIGVADDTETKIHGTFIRGFSAKYPYIKSNDFAKKYGVRFYPAAFCIDANGLVHSLADWWVPDDIVVEELLQALPLPPALPADKRWDTLRGAWRRGEFAKVAEQIGKIGALPKLDEADREVLAVQQKALDEKREAALVRIAAIAQGPDYGAAANELGRIEKAWAGLPPAAAARKELDRFEADPKLEAEVDAARALERLMSGVDTSKIPALKKVIQDLHAFRKKHEGTFAAKRAAAQTTRLIGRPPL